MLPRVAFTLQIIYTSLEVRESIRKYVSTNLDVIKHPCFNIIDNLANCGKNEI